MSPSSPMEANRQNTAASTSAFDPRLAEFQSFRC